MGDQLFGRPVILRRRQVRISASAVASRWSAYGVRRRCGETSSTSFVESAVNQVVAKRMVKKQQMRWSPKGTHLFLQVRTRVLNDDLAADFARWYPRFTHHNGPAELMA